MFRPRSSQSSEPCCSSPVAGFRVGARRLRRPGHPRLSARTWRMFRPEIDCCDKPPRPSSGPTGRGRCRQPIGASKSQRQDGHYRHFQLHPYRWCKYRRIFLQYAPSDLRPEPRRNRPRSMRHHPSPAASQRDHSTGFNRRCSSLRESPHEQSDHSALPGRLRGPSETVARHQ